MRSLIICYILISLSTMLEGQSEFVSDHKILNQIRNKFGQASLFIPVHENRSIFDRYIDGERNLIDSIENVFKSDDMKVKRSLINSMLERPYDFHFPQEIQNIILQYTKQEDLELIWLIGRYKFNGYVTLFENTLTKSSIETQSYQLYWLGKEGTSSIGFEYLKKILKIKNMDIYENTKLLDALYGYMNSGISEIKTRAVDLALDLYYSKFIYNQLLEYGEYDAEAFNERILYELFMTGDNKIEPLALSLYTQGKYQEIALSALLLHDCSKYKEELVIRINRDSNYEYIGRNASVYYISSCLDVTVIPLLLTKYFKGDIKKFVEFFNNHHLLGVLNSQLNQIQDIDLAFKINEEIIRRTKSASNVVEELFNIGVLSKSDTSSITSQVNVFQNINKSEYRGKTSIIEPYYFFIQNSPINISYGLESNDFLIHYEEIFYNASKLAQKDIGNSKIYSIVTSTKDMSSATHEIFIDFGEFGITTKHVSTSLYPDTKFIIDFLNLGASMSNNSNKYYHEFICETNVLFYTDEKTYKAYTNYLKAACDK